MFYIICVHFNLSSFLFFPPPTLLLGVCCSICWLIVTVAIDHLKCGLSKLRCALSIKYTQKFNNFSMKMKKNCSNFYIDYMLRYNIFGNSLNKIKYDIKINFTFFYFLNVAIRKLKLHMCLMLMAQIKFLSDSEALIS